MEKHDCGSVLVSEIGTNEAEGVLKNMAENKVRRTPVLDNEMKKALSISFFSETPALFVKTKNSVVRQWKIHKAS
jgi:hypothetical protein